MGSCQPFRSVTLTGVSHVHHNDRDGEWMEADGRHADTNLVSVPLATRPVS